MDAPNVGIRELKARLSEYMRRVKAGETIIITERGVPVGRLIPEANRHQLSPDEKMQQLIDAGLAEWSGQPVDVVKPVDLQRADVSVSDLIADMRE